MKKERFLLEVTHMVKIISEHSRVAAQLEMSEEVREARLRCFGHVQRRDSRYLLDMSC